MARHKDKKFKEKLVKEKNKNKKAPVWITLKTKSRAFIRARKRSWRDSKLKLTTVHKRKAARPLKHRNPKYR